MSWAIDYIGDPWIAGEHDCWAFFRRVQKEVFHVELPAFDVDVDNILSVAKELNSNEEKSNWDKVCSPKEGDAVLMAHTKYPSHIGVWVDADRGGVLHCTRGEGVVFSNYKSLEMLGWKTLTYYRHKNES